MGVDEVFKITEQLIAIPSVTGEEKLVCDFLLQKLIQRGWDVEKIPVAENRYDIFISFGIPKIIFSTHLDVVPGPDAVFKPVRKEDKLFGRGACDAKGIAATMIEVASHLLEKGEKDFGLLFVVGEEVGTGLGAKAGSLYLQNKGVQYLVNGEPTEGKLIQAHKGYLGVRILCEGVSCHSGYPSLGEDANAKLIEIAHDLLKAQYGKDEILGLATINIGLMKGGIGSNVVSPHAEASCVIRTVEVEGLALQVLKNVVANRGEIQVIKELSPQKMMALEGFKTGTVNFGTDIPNFSELGAQCLLYGPGSILVAHSDEEHISKSDIAQALLDYESIYFCLKNNQLHSRK